MSNLIERIQADILEPSVEIATLLFNAKALAHELRNERFKQWVKYELDSYPSEEDVPDYRIISVQPLGWIEGRTFSARGVPIGAMNTPEWFRKAIREVRFTSGITTAENIAQGKRSINFPWSAEWVGIWNRGGGEVWMGQKLISASCPVSHHVFAQMVQTVRSRLQDFVLELGDKWTVEEKLPSPENIERLVTVNIFNQNSQDTMSAFDQRGQSVQSQNNAMHDVNISDSQLIESETTSTNSHVK